MQMWSRSEQERAGRQRAEQQEEVVAGAARARVSVFSRWPPALWCAPCVAHGVARQLCLPRKGPARCLLASVVMCWARGLASTAARFRQAGQLNVSACLPRSPGRDPPSLQIRVPPV